MQTNDNFYKSLTLTGFCLMIGSLAFSFLFIHNTLVKGLEDGAQRAIDENLQQRLMAERQKITDELGEAAKSNPHYEAISRELIPVVARNTNREHKREYDLEIMGQAGNYGLAAAIIGLLMTIAGSWLWYVRVQRPMDAMLRAQFESQEL